MSERTQAWFTAMAFVVVMSWGIPDAVKHHASWLQIACYVPPWCAGVWYFWTLRRK